MSDWDKIAADAAIEYAKPTMRPVQTMSDHMADAFHEGARWQRRALLSDDVIERAARAIARAENADYWAEEIDRWEQSEEWERKAYPDEYPGMAYEDRGQFREAARAALTAAIGEDEK